MTTEQTVHTPPQTPHNDNIVTDKTVDNLLALYQRENFAECEDIIRTQLKKHPTSGFLWKLLGAVLSRQGNLPESINAMYRATELLPDDAQTFNNLGVALKRYGTLAESEKALRYALQLDCNFAEANNNLGVTLLALGRLKESQDCLQNAIRLQPDYAEAYCNLGICLKDQGCYKDAEFFLKHGLKLNPSSAEGYNNLGNLYQGTGRLTEAETALNKALQLKPDLAKAHNNLGNVYQGQGYLKKAEQSYLKALQYKNDYRDSFDGLLFVSNYHADKSAEEIYELYQEYDRRFGVIHRHEWQPHNNDQNPDRRLKIGYVSPSFYQHPVFNFIEPLLRNHNKNRFEIYAYSDVIREDKATLACKKQVDHWRPTVGISDTELTGQIRNDKIDILIDLAGHTGKNRLTVFAEKPAPVSLHWLDFGYTTGLSAIDYYLTDIHTAPIGSEHLFSEQLWRLPVPPFTYRPTQGMGEVGPLPALKRGYITFGTLTRAIRLNHRTIAVWSEILRRVTKSRLIIDSNNFADPTMQKKTENAFQVHGIDPDRLIIGYHSPPWDILRRVDIGLDCFPHNSGTTLFENLYMGIPYITYANRPGVGRIGSSILAGIGRNDWIAHSEDDYVEKTAALASDTVKLAEIRAGLRTEIVDSLLMDEIKFTESVECGYRAMFKKWCDTVKNMHQKPSAVNNDAAVLYNKGVDLQLAQRPDDALDKYIQALNIQADFINIYNNLGIIYQQKHEFDNAVKCFKIATTLQPDYIDAHYNLGNTYKLQADLHHAEEAYRNVIVLQPKHTDAHYNLGNILQEQGRIDEAEQELRKTLAIKPDHINAFSTLLFILNYHPDKTSKEIFDAYKSFNDLFCKPLRKRSDHTNRQRSGRRLKIGYIAPSYNKHPARYFLRPLLANHDRNSFQIFAYVNSPRVRANEDLFHPHADIWKSTTGMDDQELYDTIVKDNIDILVDLAGHTRDNRLLVFARRPAPVSLHWLDYGYTTGLSAIDYYLTDETSVPPGSQDYFSEKIWSLATPAIAYRPPATTGEINELPALKNGFISFGTLTRAVRINHRTIRVWAEILKKYPDSRLIINSGSYGQAKMRQSLAARFEEYGVENNRLEIGYNSPPWDVLRRIDIMLDCFPHNSGTTLIESLYMGIPYITLADRPSMGRLGSSILVGIGRPEWIAATEKKYINLALALAADKTGLTEIRAGLRGEMENSPLMDEPGFAKKVETAYKEMFDHWYKKKRKTKNSGRPPAAKIKELHHLYNTGKHDRALQLATSMTKKYPQHGTAWKILGPLLFQRGLTDQGIQAMERAANLLPNDADTHYNLGVARQQSGLVIEAEADYLTVIKLNKNYWQAHTNIAELLIKKGKLSKALRHYKEILVQQPDSFATLCNIGNIYRKMAKPGRAIEFYKAALKIQPDGAEPLNNLSVIYTEQGLLESAEKICRRAIDINPHMHEAHNNLGRILQERGLLDKAERQYRKALAIKEDYTAAVCNLALCLQKQGMLSESERICKEAVKWGKPSSKLLQNLALTQIRMARLDDAEINLRQAITIEPNSRELYGNLFFLLNNHPDKNGEDIYDEYVNFNGRFYLPLAKKWQLRHNNTNTERRLKVAYISYNFRKHSTRHFLEPLVARHDRKKVELFFYTDLQNEDEVTARYKTYADHWIVCAGLSDEEMAERIRNDHIDIMVDLAGHTEKNRLGVFALKPAPVSLHWLDFGYTTGLTAIDYYLTDTVSVPEESTSLFAEKPYRVPPPSVVYRADDVMGEVGSLPALKNQYVTFGTLSRALRLNHKTIRVWAEILKRVSGSHLVINSSDFRDPKMCREMMAKFTTHNIEPDRLEIGFQSPPWNTYRSLDIGLDCFPHNSGTTLIETLYMGAPFVTLADRPSVGRLGSSILHSVNHPEWIAHTEEEYIEIAVTLANDLPRLDKLRKHLRRHMENSPLMDEQGFTQKIEASYLDMFKKWADKSNTKQQQPSPAQLIQQALQQAMLLEQSGQKPEAKNLYQSILNIEADNIQANFRIGLLLLEEKEAEKALPHLESAADNAPEHGAHWFAYIKALEKSGRKEIARQLRKMAKEAGFGNVETHQPPPHQSHNKKGTQ